MKENTIYCGNNSEVLENFYDNCVDLTVTSPPYTNIRKYKGFSWNFEEIAKQLFRITKNGGVVCWVVGDQYVNGSRDLSSYKQAIYFVNCGFKMHDTIIYQKSAWNFPANNRYHQTFEYIFILTSGKIKTFNPIIDRKNKYPGQKAHGLHRGRNENEFVDMSKIVKAKPVGEFGKRTNVWYTIVGGGHVTKDKIAHKHPAIMPESLAGDLIKSFSNEGDLVLDPFCGSGTTLKMAKSLNRKYIGIDISEEYCKISEERLKL